jgi:hypothetical protein
MSKKRVRIQHYYTRTSANRPPSLSYGEIAVSHTPGSEGIYLKSDGEYEYVKIIDKNQIQKLIDDHYCQATTTKTGYVRIFGGDVSEAINLGYTAGYATSPSHFHSDYLTKKDFNAFTAETQPHLSNVETFFKGANPESEYNTLSAISIAIDELDGVIDNSNIYEVLNKKVQDIKGDGIIGVNDDRPVINGVRPGNPEFTIRHLNSTTAETVYCANEYEIQPTSFPSVIPGVGGDIPTIVPGNNNNNTVSEDNVITVSNGESFNIINTLAIDRVGHIVLSGVSAATVTIEEFKEATETVLGGVHLCDKNHDVIGEEYDETNSTDNLAANFYHTHSNYLSKKELSGSTTLNQDIIISCGFWTEEDEWE